VLFGFDTYAEHQADGDTDATRLVRLDPTSLREQLFSSLRLGDSTTGHVFSPDRRSLAFGAVNVRQVIVADLVDYRVAARITVAHAPAPDSGWPAEVFVVAWPRADRLVAYTQPFAAHTSAPARLVVVDPGARHVIRTAPLGGSVVATASLDDGRTVFVVAPTGRVGPARVVVVDPDGGARSIRLPEISAGFGNGSDEAPGFAVVGTVAYVLGSSNRIAQVDLDTGRVRDHAVPGLLAERLTDGPPLEPGSGGIMSNDERHVTSLGNGLLSVGGYDTRPARRGTENQSYVRSEQIVDTKSWVVRRTLRRVTDLVAANGLYYCWVGSGLFDSLTFVALRPDGTVAFRRTTPEAGWEISAGRLFETRGDAGDVELDPLTGRVVRRVSTPPTGSIDLVPWSRP